MQRAREEDWQLVTKKESNINDGRVRFMITLKQCILSAHKSNRRKLNRVYLELYLFSGVCHCGHRGACE